MCQMEITVGKHMGKDKMSERADMGGHMGHMGMMHHDGREAFRSLGTRCLRWRSRPPMV